MCATWCAHNVDETNMQYVERFSDEELAHIVEAGLIYMCACPAQVADAIRKLRELYWYQMNCLNDPMNYSSVHQIIAESTIVAHSEMQNCLDRVLEIEEWDRATLTMPKGLRKRQMDELLRD